jgi:hypothetical protein
LRPKVENKVNMPDSKDFSGLGPLLDNVEEAAAEEGELSVSRFLEALGPRGFGPLMLIPALLVISPFSALVGFDSLMGALIAVVAVQMVIGRKHLWLPERVLAWRIGIEKLEKTIGWLRPVARRTDKVIRPRLRQLTRAPFSRMAAALCAVIGSTMPPLELVPFSNTAGAAIVALLSLGLTVRDGALIAAALVLLPAAIGGGAYLLLT